jgi:glycosyltransferase involved in cell wall biosynthesis
MVISEKYVNRPLVSVNLTTYERAHLLPRALDSVLNQSYQQLELIVVDDGSTDDTSAVVAEYQLRDDRIKYYRHNANQGNARARNTALTHCTGEFVAFMDDDDEWIDPDKLARQLDIFRRSPDVGIVCSSVRRYASEAKYDDLLIQKPPDLTSHILGGNGIIYSPTVMVRRSTTIELGGFDEGMSKGVDSEFFRRCIVTYGYDVYIMPEITTAVHAYGMDRMTPVLTLSDANRSLMNDARLLRKYWPAYVRYPGALRKRLMVALKRHAAVLLLQKARRG